MKIVATFKKPNYFHERRMCGINSFRTVVHPDGYTYESIICDSLEELKEKVSWHKYQEVHSGPRRQLTLEDVTITVTEEN